MIIELQTLDGLRREVDYWRTQYALVTAPPPPPGILDRVRHWFQRHQLGLVGGGALIAGAYFGWVVGHSRAEIACCSALPARCGPPLHAPASTQ